MSVSLSVPIGHVVLRTPTFCAAADSCKTGGGGWSTDLRFWWHVHYPEDVVLRTRLKNNKSGLMISINVLELICVIINDLSTYPVMLNWCDNTAACSWVSHRCKESLIGRRLARLLVGLLVGTKLGIQAEWISTFDNGLADEISRLTTPVNRLDFDYSTFLSSHPALTSCRLFQPSQFLLGMIWDVLLHKNSPDPLIVRHIEPKTLGHFIS